MEGLMKSICEKESIQIASNENYLFGEISLNDFINQGDDLVLALFFYKIGHILLINEPKFAFIIKTEDWYENLIQRCWNMGEKVAVKYDFDFDDETKQKVLERKRNGI